MNENWLSYRVKINLITNYSNLYPNTVFNIYVGSHKTRGRTTIKV